MGVSGGERWKRNGGIESKNGVTPLSSIRDLSSFASQSSLFGGRVSGGNGFSVRVGVRGGVRGGGEGGVSSEILQAIQMDQSPLYASQGFGRRGVISGSGGLVGGKWMLPRRRGGWKRRGTSSLSYRPRLSARGNMVV